MKIVLYMAPIMGYTNALYRNLYTKHFKGFDLAITPFITSIGLDKLRDRHIKDVLPENNTGLPVIPQILSNDAEGFICLAKRLFDLGYDTINWNLGCPFPMVANKMRGSGLLSYPDKIDLILDSVLSEIPNTLSIKLRLGRKQPDEIFKLLPVFNRYPISELILHPRTGIQMYKGIVYPEVFEECMALTHIPLMYNGDINNLEIFESFAVRFPSLKRFMLGRGAIADPFLPNEIKSGIDSSVDKVLIFRRFHDELVENYKEMLDGPGHVLGRMKGYWSFFYLSFKDGKKLFKKIKKTSNLSNFIDIINRFFEKDAQWTS